MKHVPISNMRLYTTRGLKALTEPEVVCHHSEPLAVMVPYELFMRWQREVVDLPRAVKMTIMDSVSLAARR